MNPQDFVKAQQAAWGAGTVIENAERWPRRKVSAEVNELIVALDNTVKLARQLLEIVVKGNEECMTRDEAKRLSTRLMTSASIAYRLIRQAVGEPMFEPGVRAEKIPGEAEDVAPTDTGILP